MKNQLRKVLNKFGFDIVRHGSIPGLDVLDQTVLDCVQDYTMTSRERILAVVDATRYIARNKIPGAIVECGVWRGGSSMAAAYTLMQEKDADRCLYLYDTFTGMTPPSDMDISHDGSMARDLFPTNQESWCAAEIDDVKQNLYGTGYPNDLINFIVGRVEETVTPNCQPEEIALLRLDTDWYESTLHELTHLFPRLAKNGVLIIDDYGHWQGARKAVDEYLARYGLDFLLYRIDYSGRMLIKTQ